MNLTALALTIAGTLFVRSQTAPDQLLLKDYKPRSLFKIPETRVERARFRLLETDDEHFYPVHFRKYHWPMNAFALPDDVLKKLYRGNALKVLRLN